MKIFIFSLSLLISHITYAGTISEPILTCTFTESKFDAIPITVGTYKFIEEPGLVPAASGSFKVPGENITILVSSMLIANPNSKTEYVNTSFTFNIDKTSITTSSSNAIDDQLAYAQINNSGFVLCVATK